MLMKDLTVSWLDRLKNRRRRPVKPASLAAFSSYVRNWINPQIGGLEVGTFENGALRQFAEFLVSKNLAPKTVHEITTTVKQIVASAQDENGNQLYPRHWNNEFILENVPDVKGQRQPTITKEQLKEALKVRHTNTDKYRILVALLAASGIRVGELLALRVGDDGKHSGWDQENSLLTIRTSLWNGKEQEPKTQSSIRLVDLSQSVNMMLVTYTQITSKNSGDYLFSTKKGRPYRAGFLQRCALKPLGIPGFHSARRYRVTYLKTTGTPDPLLKFWLGHSSGNDVTAKYDKSATDKEWRQTWVNRLGVGFDLPTSGHPAPSAPQSFKLTEPTPPAKRKRRLNRLEVLLQNDPADAEKYQATNEDLPTELFTSGETERTGQE